MAHKTPNEMSFDSILDYHVKYWSEQVQPVFLTYFLSWLKTAWIFQQILTTFRLMFQLP